MRNERLEQVKFHNSANPRSAFDMIRLEDVLGVERAHDPTKFHRVDFFILLLVTEGKGKHSIDFEDFPYSAGTLLTIRKDQIHKFSKNVGSKGYLLLFLQEFLVSYLEELEANRTLLLFNELIGSPRLKLSPNIFKEFLAIVHRIELEYTKNLDDHSLSIIRSELHILCTKLYRSKSKGKQLAFHKKYLKEFISFQDLVESQVKRTNKVLDYANMLGMSTKTLNKVTKSIVNQSAKEFIDDIYIKQIKRLLINTTLSIKEVAFQSGFEETSNFYKFFKRHLDSTPEAFRAAQ